MMAHMCARPHAICVVNSRKRVSCIGRPLLSFPHTHTWPFTARRQRGQTRARREARTRARTQQRHADGLAARDLTDRLPWNTLQAQRHSIGQLVLVAHDLKLVAADVFPLARRSREWPFAAGGGCGAMG